MRNVHNMQYIIEQFFTLLLNYMAMHHQLAGGNDKTLEGSQLGALQYQGKNKRNT